MTDQLHIDSDLDTVLRLECQITDHVLSTSHCYTHFSYVEGSDGDPDELKLITYNRYHQRVFMLKEFKGESHVGLLETALKYVKETMTTENNYTVNWTDLNLQKSFVSYFRGHNVTDVKAKFYCNNQNVTEIKIDKITLSPMS